MTNETTEGAGVQGEEPDLSEAEKAESEEAALHEAAMREAQLQEAEIERVAKARAEAEAEVALQEAEQAEIEAEAAVKKLEEKREAAKAKAEAIPCSGTFGVGDKVAVPARNGECHALVVACYRSYAEACGAQTKPPFDSILPSACKSSPRAQPHYYCEVANPGAESVGAVQDKMRLLAKA